MYLELALLWGIHLINNGASIDIGDSGPGITIKSEANFVVYVTPTNNFSNS